MPSYSYNDGDGLSVIDKTVPNGAVEPVSNLDDAIKQVKAYLKDATAGVSKIQSDVTSHGTRLTTAESDITALEAADVVHDASIENLLARITSLETIAQSILGTTPATAIVTMGSTQSVTSAAGATAINFDTISLDTYSAYNTTTKSFVAPTAGLYQVIVSLGLTTTASSTPTVIKHTLEVLVAGVSAAKVMLEVDTSTADRTIQLARAFQLSATQALTFKYTVATASGTMTTTFDYADATKTLLQVMRLSA